MTRFIGQRCELFNEGHSRSRLEKPSAFLRDCAKLWLRTLRNASVIAGGKRFVFGSLEVPGVVSLLPAPHDTEGWGDGDELRLEHETATAADSRAEDRTDALHLRNHVYHRLERRQRLGKTADVRRFCPQPFGETCLEHARAVERHQIGEIEHRSSVVA